MSKFLSENFYSALASNIMKSPAGYRYGFVPNAFKPDMYAELVKSFPSLDKFKYLDIQGDPRSPLTRLYSGPRYDSKEHAGKIDHLQTAQIWKDMLTEFSTVEHITNMKQATGVDINSLREYVIKYGKEGCEMQPHIDQSALTQNPARTRLISMFYFADQPGGGPGAIRLYDKDTKTVFFEVPDMHNSMFFFEQHPDAWYGDEQVPAGKEWRKLVVPFNIESKPVAIKTGSSLFGKLFSGK